MSSFENGLIMTKRKCFFLDLMVLYEYEHDLIWWVGVLDGGSPLFGGHNWSCTTQLCGFPCAALVQLARSLSTLSV